MEATTSSRDTHREEAPSGCVPIDHQDYNYNTRRANEVSEIIEIIEEEDEEILAGKSGGRKSQKLVPISENGIETNTTSLFSIDIHHKVNSARYSSSDDVVYVAVGKSESSMDALLWALTHCVHPGSTLVYLIHIFPDLKFIPSPFGGGMVPKTSVTPDLVESYMMEDSRKRRELLNKYVDMCTSHMVQVETILIESDSVINAIVELISVLNIRRLIVGISKSNLRKMKVRKGSNIVADQIRQTAPQDCELKIIHQGKELELNDIDGVNHLNSSSPVSSPTVVSIRSRAQYDDHEQQQSPTSPFSCCFKG
ncbi:unnamed protein product [Amaranthus hypochondriacus]